MKILRILSAVAFLVFVLVAAFPAEAKQIQDQALEVSVQRANVRDAPSLQGEVIFQVSLNERLRVVQKEGNWYFAETESGRRGYISSTVVRVIPFLPEKPSANPVETTPAFGNRPISQSSGPIRNSDVVAMAKAGLSDSVIIAAIKQSESVEFDLSPAGLITLKTAGVSETVIQALLDRSGPAGPPASSTAVRENSSLTEKPRITGLPPENPQLVLTKPAGFGEWNNRLEGARAKRGRGMKFIVFGIAATVGGQFVGVATNSPGAVVAIALAGGGLTGYGGWTWYSARQEIEDLDQEGRIKGYLTLAPRSGGAQVVLNFSF